MTNVLWTLLLTVWVIGTNARQDQPKRPLIRLEDGEIRGIVERDGKSHRKYYAFLGIPYARVTERFQAARPVKPWKNIFEANNGSVKCIQRSWLNTFTSGSMTVVSGREDCLILNIYTPQDTSDTSELKPVMFFIHGGGFREGSASPLLYGPQYLIRQDVVLVVINYRLENLGFLCLRIKEAPGNVGLKDQVLALKWVKKNIKAFGGDPENVSIFGESAGSASVSYHLLSPMSKGLFHKAIMQSGSAMSYWAIQFEPVKVASKLAKQMGYNSDDPHELYNFFMDTSAEELLATRIPRDKGDIVQSENIFVPCLEKKIPGVDPFITETPFDILSRGKYMKVPIIMGYNSVEGYYFVGMENSTTKANMSVYKSLPRDLKFPNQQVAKETAKVLRRLYFGAQDQSLLHLVNYEGEVGISYPTVATADLFLQTNNRPIYLYLFAYSGLLNLVKIGAGFGQYPGASHADELFYMFKPKLTSISGFLETEMIKKITTMWGNFAKYGDPTPKESLLFPKRWRAAKKKKPKLLVIDRNFSTVPLWPSQTLAYWDQTYSLYRRKY